MCLGFLKKKIVLKLLDHTVYFLLHCSLKFTVNKKTTVHHTCKDISHDGPLYHYTDRAVIADLG